MDIENIIPPSDYKHRNGFNNVPLINKLTRWEKRRVENALIDKLAQMKYEDVDTLIIETLAYLKSKKAIPQLEMILENCSNDLVKLIVATSIFEISQDNDMVNVAITSLKKLDNIKDAYYVYKLTSAFYYLIKFNNQEINKIIEEYINHKEYLIAYNAKRALGLK